MTTAHCRFRFHCAAISLVTPLLLIGASTLVAEDSDRSQVDVQIIVTVSVDWEGFPLVERNLKAMEAFREEFPNVPLTHFLNAAHYCRDQSTESVTKKIRRVMRGNDETGVHIHCWRSFVEAAGVAYRKQPTFWRESIPLKKYSFDEGHEVELAAYTENEVAKLASKSVEILTENGFEVSMSFRAAGWIASREVLAGIRKAGFEIDSSSTDRNWVESELAKFDIYERLGEMWPKVSQHTQPYQIKTSAGELLEMPNTGAMADYVTSDEMDLHLREVIAKAKDGETRFVHIGFHQESAAQFITRVAQSLAKWAGNSQIKFMTLKDAAKEYRRQTREKRH